MERVYVNSSNLISVRYDEETQILELEFKNGIYQYYDVPDEIYEWLMAAQSHWKYFINSIKDKFICKKK